MWLSCHTVCRDRVRDASGHGTRWIVPSPHAPRRRRRTPAPMPATGATRGPVRGCWGRGGGCGRGGGFARRGPAVGLDGGRPETDAHRGIIGRSWPSKSPLRALLEAVTRPPPAAVDRRPIRTDPVDPAPSVVSAARRPPTFRFPVAPPRARVDRRAARPRPPDRRDLFHDPARDWRDGAATAHLRPPGADPGRAQRRLPPGLPGPTVPVPEHRPRPGRPSHRGASAATRTPPR